ncbi:PASTA domain-containing protein [Streptomyces celluloflavus]|uniref:PASTA domain-containing protein n=1 Tax=Streptomyces celluloflavus TaxID=58344 RepID=UPI0036662047
MKKIIAAALLALSALALTGPAHADGTPMPNVTGKGLSVAYKDLNHNKSIQLKDGLGAHRHVLWPANWKVCEQNPAPGTPLNNQKVTLTVVKHQEKCGKS